MYIENIFYEFIRFQKIKIKYVGLLWIPRVYNSPIFIVERAIVVLSVNIYTFIHIIAFVFARRIAIDLIRL